MELDFLYVPSADVAADATYWVNVMGARLVFAVDGMGARVAMLSERHTIACMGEQRSPRDQLTAVQVPSGLRQALPRATSGWPSM